MSKPRLQSEQSKDLVPVPFHKPVGELASWVRQDRKLALAYYTLTIQEMRLIWDLAARIRSTDNDFTEYEFTLAELRALFGRHMKFVEAEEVLLRLYRRELHVENDSGTREALRWVISAVRDEASETFRLALHPKLKNYFLGLQEWVQAERATLCAFSSEYAARLYMMACVYRNKDKQSWEITIADLRAKFGISPEEYQRFSNLRVRVLDAPIKEIEERAAPFKMSYTIKKDGKTPSKILFQLDEWARTTNGMGKRVAARIGNRRKVISRKAKTAERAATAALEKANAERMTDEERVAFAGRHVAEMREKIGSVQTPAHATKKREKPKYHQWTAEEIAEAEKRNAATRRQLEMFERNKTIEENHGDLPR